MSGKTKIEWCDKVWNPVTGCTPVSAGCDHCYAARMAKRLAGRCGYPKDDPFKVTVHPWKITDPFSWRNLAKVFVNSMGDLFHEDVSDKFIDRVFTTMRIASYKLTFLILTKRPDRMLWYLKTRYTNGGWSTQEIIHHNAKELTHQNRLPIEWPLRNVWMGVTAENQEMADERIPLLLETPAAVRFVSVEPMLGPVNLWRYLPDSPLETLDWVICGGETGPGARPMHPNWVRSLRDQCLEAGVPFFFKGWGEWNSELDQVFPRRGVVTLNGTYIDCRSVGIIEALKDKSAARVCKSGKKWSGRMLDGREWNDFPNPLPAAKSAAAQACPPSGQCRKGG